MRTRLLALAAPLALAGCGETPDASGTALESVTPPPICSTIAECEELRKAVVRDAFRRLPDSLKFRVVDDYPFPIPYVVEMPPNPTPFERAFARVMTKPPNLTDAERARLREIRAQEYRLECPRGCEPIPMTILRSTDRVITEADMRASLRECASGRRVSGCPDVPEGWYEKMGLRETQ